MAGKLYRYIREADMSLFIAAAILTLLGIVTMSSFVGDDPYFSRQILWFFIAGILFFVAHTVDWRFLRRTKTAVVLFIIFVLLLLAVAFLGTIAKGAQSWLSLGFFNLQPADPAKIALIIILSKYFTRRYVAIGHSRHIIVSGLYAFIFFFLVFIQPDFGSAIIMFIIWFAMVMVSGISKKHLALVIGGGLIAFLGLWLFIFQPYQKDRIISFIHPLADIRGAGYNAYQSTVAVGSGEILGKGIGFGTQSKLKFLPEYQTDFIFAAFSEEWGFIGGIIVIGLFGFIIVRLMSHAARAPSNFETLFSVGVASMFLGHITIHIGMNIGLLPVTGVPLPFMSYGGSHLVTEFFALGVVSSMSRFALKSRSATGDLDLM